MPCYILIFLLYAEISFAENSRLTLMRFLASRKIFRESSPDLSVFSYVDTRKKIEYVVILILILFDLQKKKLN